MATVNENQRIQVGFRGQIYALHTGQKVIKISSAVFARVLLSYSQPIN